MKSNFKPQSSVNLNYLDFSVFQNYFFFLFLFELDGENIYSCHISKQKLKVERKSILLVCVRLDLKDLFFN